MLKVIFFPKKYIAVNLTVTNKLKQPPAVSWLGLTVITTCSNGLGLTPSKLKSILAS